MPFVISVKNLVKTYVVGEVEVRALRGVSLDVQPGEFVAVTGPSGSGKSTFMHIAGCLDRPTAGQYFLDGKDVSKESKDSLAKVRNQRIGFVFQGFNLLTRTTALDNVELPMLYRSENSFRSAERHKRALKALDMVGLGSRYHHMPNQLSGGQQQRVAIARALVNDPKIILADEPTGNLDAANEQIVLNLLTDLHGQGRTILMVTHADHVGRYADIRINLEHGHIIETTHFSMEENQDFDEVLEQLWMVRER